MTRNTASSKVSPAASPAVSSAGSLTPTLSQGEREPKRPLIIGFGSDIRGDDALGPMAAQRIEELVGDAVTVVTCQGLTPDLAAPIADASRVVFIDASATGTPGDVLECAVIPADATGVAMVHFLNPSALLTWTEMLYHHCPEAVLLTVPGASFEVSDELTEPVAAALGKVVERVLDIIGLGESARA